MNRFVSGVAVGILGTSGCFLYQKHKKEPVSQQAVVDTEDSSRNLFFGRKPTTHSNIYSRQNYVVSYNNVTRVFYI
jgi:hypothetical protein